MLERVRVFRVLAAADVAAGEAHAELVPARAVGQALLAAVGARRDFPDLAEVLAALAQGRDLRMPSYAFAGAPMIRIAVFETCIVSKYA